MNYRKRAHWYALSTKRWGEEGGGGLATERAGRLKRVRCEAAGPGPGTVALRGHGASSRERGGDRKMLQWQRRFLGAPQARGSGEISAASGRPRKEPGTAASSTLGSRRS
ncbi:hypothetical protein NDU88_002487 [Pleurodeles waltl]|uniref:Uncharacterized protein n=1 Tax=Pleurodeles waltl TaxID=8319 RepID=A0AAV7NDS5_PLEWA|nr:hypothetical protein NDU88_002487 [Pleurodeles waltl]